MELDPSTYRCPTHGVDLTELVREQVSELGRVLYKRPADSQFRVIVTCPGQGSEHELGCTGTIVDDG
jgi:hypothetical protein